MSPIEITDTFADNFLDESVKLWRVSGLDVAAWRFSRFDFAQLGPEVRVSPQRVHHHCVAGRVFRMTRVRCRVRERLDGERLL